MSQTLQNETTHTKSPEGVPTAGAEQIIHNDESEGAGVDRQSIGISGSTEPAIRQGSYTVTALSSFHATTSLLGEPIGFHSYRLEFNPSHRLRVSTSANLRKIPIGSPVFSTLLGRVISEEEGVSTTSISTAPDIITHATRYQVEKIARLSSDSATASELSACTNDEKRMVEEGRKMRANFRRLKAEAADRAAGRAVPTSTGLTSAQREGLERMNAKWRAGRGME